MKTFRIILLTLFSILNIYLLYSTIMYIVLAIQTPNIIGETTTQFGEMYLMSAFCLFGVIICTLFIILISKKMAKNRQK